MKITGINVKTVKVPLKEPFHISLGTITHAISAVVRWKRMKDSAVMEKVLQVY